MGVSNLKTLGIGTSAKILCCPSVEFNSFEEKREAQFPERIYLALLQARKQALHTFYDSSLSHYWALDFI